MNTYKNNITISDCENLIELYLKKQRRSFDGC